MQMLVIREGPLPEDLVFLGLPQKRFAGTEDLPIHPSQIIGRTHLRIRAVVIIVEQEGKQQLCQRAVGTERCEIGVDFAAKSFIAAVHEILIKMFLIPMAVLKRSERGELFK